MRSVLAIAFIIALMPRTGRCEAPATRPTRYTTLLKQQCDALIASAIKRPYGWAWADTGDNAPPATLPGKRIPVSFELGATPSGGLVLLYASELLHDPAYAQAARNVARGLAAGQQPSGRFPDKALFGTTAVSSTQPRTQLPSRAATRASLALLLSLVDDTNKGQEVVPRAASRGSLWLMRQQAEPGGWPIMFPPNVPPADATRLIRLDTPDTRDDILTMLLAYEVLGDPFQRRSVERSIEYLLKVRSGAGLQVGPGLWQSACTLSGLPPEKSLDFPPGCDTLASRYSMQAFFGVWVILGDGQRLIAADLAAHSIQDLIKNDDGLWHRRYNATGVSLDPLSTTQQAHAFGPAMVQAPTNDPALVRAIDSIAAAKTLGRDKYRDLLRQHAPLKQHLAEVVSGLSDDCMPSDFPTSPEQVAPFLQQHEAYFRIIQSDSTDFDQRVKQIHATTLRALIESQFGI